MTTHRTVPVETERMPSGIPFIIGNELAERFSYYGMKTILVVYMTKYMLDSTGGPAPMSDEDAKAIYHAFNAANYFFPLLGALLADIFLGKYRTIILLSIGYCVGHGLIALGDSGPGMAIMSPRAWLLFGLLFIAIGSGGIKPCVSAHVGDQFGRRNQSLVEKVFSWFYFSINVGAATSSLLTPILLDRVGPWLAFGLPGALMVLATLVFWMGRNRFVHIPPAGQSFWRETFSPDGLRALRNLAPLFLIFVPAFWALFDQTGSAWVIQAMSMDRDFLGVHWLEAQVQAVNPLLILILIPFFAYVVYPFCGRFFEVTPLRRIGVGLFLTAAAFALSGLIQVWIDAGRTPNIGWQFLAYVVITAAEVLVSITTLEFAYTQAPRRMKSFIMGVYFLGVSVGNLFTSAVNWAISIPAVTKTVDGQEVVITEAASRLAGADYYWFFTALVLVFAVAFVIFAQFYRGRRFVQGEEDGTIPPAGGSPPA